MRFNGGMLGRQSLSLAAVHHYQYADVYKMHVAVTNVTFDF